MQISRPRSRYPRPTTRGLLGLALLASFSVGCSSSEFTLSDGFGSSASGYSGGGLTAGDEDTGDDTTTGLTDGGDGDGTTGSEGDDSDGTSGGEEAGTNSVGECDPFAQDCDPGLKCSWIHTEYGPVTACVPKPDLPAPDGAACAVPTTEDPFDPCGLGSYCAFGDSYGVGVCTPLCEGSADDPTCQDTGSVCRLCDDCPSVCLAVCDPLDDMCGDGLVCAASMQLGAFVCTMDASTDNGGGLNDPCEFANECGPGLACAPGELLADCDAGGCCTSYCDTEDPTMCAALDYCTAWPLQASLPGYENVGVCTATTPVDP